LKNIIEKMLKIKYITNVRIPSVRAQSYAIMKVCEEFALTGSEIELIVPERKNSEVKDDPFKYHNIKRIFSIKKIKSLDLLGDYFAFGKIFYWLDVLSFLFSLKRSRVVNVDDIVYTRDFLVALLFSSNNTVCLEIHDIPSSKFLFNRALKNSKYLFVLTNSIKKILVDRGIPEEKIFISPSGVDLKEFEIDDNKTSAREHLGLKSEGSTVVYTGHLYKWKGADTIARVAETMPKVNFVFVGGAEPEITEFTKKYKDCKNIIQVPFVQRNSIPYYLKSADILVLPNSSKEDISNKYTSPLKLFEYMSSKRPIIASDLPSLREVLTAENCLFAIPNDATSFRTGIETLLKNNDLANKLSSKAHEDVLEYTWQKKVLNILSIIK
jgi:glycosyltransferase involved in cell wall biosynthesis